MNEKEKMINGYLYFSGDEDLYKERLEAKDLCFKYNNTAPSDTKARMEIIRKLFSKTGEFFNIESDF